MHIFAFLSLIFECTGFSEPAICIRLRGEVESSLGREELVVILASSFQ